MKQKRERERSGNILFNGSTMSAGLLSSLRIRRLLNDLVFAICRSYRTLATWISAQEWADFSHLACFLFNSWASRLRFFVVFLTQLWENWIWKKFENCRCYPSSETYDDCNEPVVTMESTFCNFHSITANEDNRHLAAPNEDVNYAECRIVKDTL